MAPKTDFLLFLAFSSLGRPLDKKSGKPCRLLRLLGAKIAKISFWTLFAEFHPFSDLALKNRKNSILSSKWGNRDISIFCVLAVRTDPPTHIHTEDRILSRSPLLAPLERSPWEGLRFPPLQQYSCNRYLRTSSPAV